MHAGENTQCDNRMQQLFHDNTTFYFDIITRTAYSPTTGEGELTPPQTPATTKLNTCETI
jgi:hypothetical protein